MPLVTTGPYTTSYLVYDAPVDEKTKKLRETFKIDESGYPEHYKWRNMAKLGPVYNPEDPILKFTPQSPEAHYSTSVFMAFFTGMTTVGAVGLYNYFNKTPLWARVHYSLPAWAGFFYIVEWFNKKTDERQYIKNSIIIDYTNKHPDRFGPIKRSKFRETLFEYLPVR